MFKKRFNKEVGELRICKKCDNEFYTHKPVWQCTKCLVKQVKEYNQSKHTPKDNYPFNNKELYGNHGATRRFTQIRKRLNQCKTREELTQHYDRQLKEIEENGILKWILDERGRYKKKKITIDLKAYPNTKNVNHDDYI